MANWAGFSDEDLKKLQKNGSKSPRSDDSATSLRPDKKKASLMSKPRPQRAVQPMKKEVSSPSSDRTDLSSQALLSNRSESAHVITESQNGDKAPCDTSQISKEPTRPQAQDKVEPVDMGSQAQEKVEPVDMGSQDTANLLTEDDGVNRELSNLQQYQQKQKMMEELNKKKKQMLSTALAQRQKQATVENHKLNSIKKELSHLDQMLNADVNVIRDRIEEATREYAEASKRYELAEKEFIAAKISLHKRSELKEQLIEHLYTIIHQNEMRKAKKLAELMNKLNLATEENNSDSTLPELPGYSLLGNMSTFSSGNLTRHTTHTTHAEDDVSTPTKGATSSSSDSPKEEVMSAQSNDIPAIDSTEPAVGSEDNSIAAESNIVASSTDGTVGASATDGTVGASATDGTVGASATDGTVVASSTDGAVVVSGGDNNYATSKADNSDDTDLK